MTDCHWTAREIMDKVNHDEKGLAGGMLQSEMNRLSPDEFKRLVNDMVKLSHNDDNDSNDVQFETDKNGEIKNVTINDGYIFDTVLARRGALTPLRIVETLNGDCRLD